jgi:hypothetical protein
VPRGLKNYETGQNYLIALAFSHAFDPVGPLVEVLRTVSSSSTVGPNDVVMLLKGNAFTTTLPPPIVGRVLVFKDASGNANLQPKTIAASGGATIDGAATFTLNIASAAVRLTADGTEWFVTAAYNGTVV